MADNCRPRHSSTRREVSSPLSKSSEPFKKSDLQVPFRLNPHISFKIGEARESRLCVHYVSPNRRLSKETPSVTGGKVSESWVRRAGRREPCGRWHAIRSSSERRNRQLTRIFLSYNMSINGLVALGLGRDSRKRGIRMDGKSSDYRQYWNAVRTERDLVQSALTLLACGGQSMSWKSALTGEGSSDIIGPVAARAAFVIPQANPRPSTIRALRVAASDPTSPSFQSGGCFGPAVARFGIFEGRRVAPSDAAPRGSARETDRASGSGELAPAWCGLESPQLRPASVMESNSSPDGGRRGLAGPPYGTVRGGHSNMEP
jgi:hypothetical protein